MKSLLLLAYTTSLTLSAGPAHGQESPALFRQHCAALAAAAARDGQSVIAGCDGWLFLASELRYVGAGQFRGDAASLSARAGVRPEYADPLPAILDFHAQLRELDVKLLLVPVPPKCLIFPDKLPAPETDPAPLPAVLPDAGAASEFYEILRGSGVQALDLAEMFRAHRADEHGAPYCASDSHWSGNGCVLAARAIAGIIRADLPAAPDNVFDAVWGELEIKGDLTRMPGGTAGMAEKLMVRRVTRRAGADVSGAPAHAPVILLGDSHNLIFNAGGDMHTVGAGLPDQLAAELGAAVELAAVRGSGATPARVNLYRRAARDPDYWRGRRWVVWCFAAREFTESDGWRKVPVRAAPAEMPAADANMQSNQSK